MASANDKAWERFFQLSSTLPALRQEGFCYIHAEEMKELAGREPRLMAKLDTLSERPQVFREEKLNILPVRNGVYLLFRDIENKSYFRLDGLDGDKRREVFATQVDLAKYDAFPTSGLFSESQAIDYAKVSGLLEHYLGLENLHLTIRGRLYSGDFSFKLPALPEEVRVSNVQIEVDAGYENGENLVLLEAKIGQRDNFHIRQLFYPIRQWQARTRKTIRPVLLTYSNGEFTFTEFAYDRERETDSAYGALRILNRRHFVVNEEALAFLDLNALLKEVPLVFEPPAIPFPQANDLDKVVDLLLAVSAGFATRQQFAECFEYDLRQADYYGNAAAYLSLVERVEKRGFILTEVGRNFLALSRRNERTRALVKLMLARSSFRQALLFLQANGYRLELLDERKLVALIRENSELGESTCLRRASTMKKWLTWICANAQFTT